MLPKIFTNVSVLDFSRLLPGPFASGLLARLGAEVTCVLPPQKDAVLGDYSPFAALREGKRFVTVDLKTESGLAEARRLAAGTSILLEGFRPGTMERLGLGFDSLQALNPDLLYVSLVGYPAGHPKYLAGGHDLNFLIDSGIYQLLYGEGGVQLPALQIADVMGGFYAAFQILAAWIERMKGPGSRRIEVSVMESLALMQEYRSDEAAAGILPMLTGSLARYRIYKTKDHRSVAVAGLEPKFHAALLETLGLEARPGEGEEALAGRIQAVFATRDAAEWGRIFAKVDACLSFF
ncbi:MAG TPA: CaiB/BaiF CoA-transferase family protein [bacterium]|nr:CaiB/BaiF CoA-transferase family protein [bacterium]